MTAFGNIPLETMGRLPRALIGEIFREEHADSHHLGMAILGTSKKRSNTTDSVSSDSAVDEKLVFSYRANKGSVTF